ncbi:hypothetical protein [Mesorhizobium sp.]|uniref:hypothetical protein n=1 Tax=Mesorhizobium sp. TaxID=1871066 RepID=UPI0025E66748|nr:hypothetical protein [Mesorhizobium sp.]
MDDATTTIYSGFLTEEEGTASTFRALEEVFGGHGLALSLYTDRGSHYFHTPQAGGKIDRTNLAQVGRVGSPWRGAGNDNCVSFNRLKLQISESPLRRVSSTRQSRCAAIMVVYIAAYSPQARGRSEQVFHTLQDRLTKELALAGITAMEEANAFLRDVYIPAHNKRFVTAQTTWPVKDGIGRPGAPPECTGSHPDRRRGMATKADPSCSGLTARPASGRPVASFVLSIVN